MHNQCTTKALVMQIYKNMLIPQETINNWESVIERGDKVKLAKKMKIHRNTINNILMNGKATARQIKIIEGFFRPRLELKEKLKTEVCND